MILRRHLFARRPRRAAGFTLIELMVVVAIIAILAGAGIGMSTTWRRSAAFKRMAREIYSGLNVARAEAIKRGQTVKMEISPQRLTVFIDNTNPNEFDTSDLALYQYPIDPMGPLAGKVSGDMGDFPAGMTVDTTVLQSLNAGRPIITFNYEGFCLDTTGEPMEVTLPLADAKISETKEVHVSIAGALRVR